VSTVIGSRAGGARWTSERKFYFGMALLLFAVAFVGFSRTFYLDPLFPPQPYGATEGIFLIHGAFITAWFLLLILQPTLIAKGDIRRHMAVGAAGAALAAVLVLVAIYGALVAAARPGGFMGVPIPPLAFLAIPMMDMLLFSVFVTLAISNRHDAQAHKRLMLIATVQMCGAAFARFPFEFIATGSPLVFFGLQSSLLIPLVAWDFLSRKRLHAMTVLGVVVTVLSAPFKLWLAANHRPTIRGTDYAIWRRIRLVPFTVQIPPEQQDKGLKAALRAELSGILSWAVAGCLMWQREALGEPLAVSAATAQYRRDSDTLGAFLEDCCEEGDGLMEPASELYAAYHRWCQEGGEFELSQTQFGRKMEERGFPAEKRSGGLKWRLGLRLVSRATVPTVPTRDLRGSRWDSSPQLSHDD